MSTVSESIRLSEAGAQAAEARAGYIIAEVGRTGEAFLVAHRGDLTAASALAAENAAIYGRPYGVFKLIRDYEACDPTEAS